MTNLDPRVFFALTAAAFGLMIVRFFSQSSANRRPRNLFPAVVLGCAGLAVAGVQYILAGVDRQRFDTDPGCRAGFARHDNRGGPCRVLATQITGFWVTRGRSHSRKLDVLLANGSRVTVTYGADEYGSVWRGVRDRNDRAGWAQRYNNDIVAIETQSGVVDTAAMPAQRMTLWAWIGMIAGATGTFYALIEAFRLRG